LQPLETERVKEWRHRRMLSQQEVADRAGTSLFTIQRIERGEGNVRPKTGRGVAAALGIPIEDLLPTAQAELFREPLEHELLEERRAEATGRSAEERVEISNALAESIEHLNSGYGEALEQFAGGAPGAPEEIFSLYMQASLTLIGAKTVAGDAGYAEDADGDSRAERAAKRKMREALALLEETIDEIERISTAAELEQQLPEGVAWLASYQRRAV
jgi:transcriptional regulator with XRE-family HTH domain